MSDSTTTILQLNEAVKVFCSERDWDKYHGTKDLAIGIVTEAYPNYQFNTYLISR